MRKSRKFISMQVISLEDGQQIGHVRGLVINPVTKSVSALQVDQKKWFKEQKIIPFTKIRSIGDDVITIEKNSNVQRPANLPEIVSLLKEKVELIGAKVIAENGITLGYVDDFFIETSSGQIVNLEISGNVIDSFLKGKAHLSIEHVRTIGKNVLVAAEGAESFLEPLDGGFQETLRNLRDTSAQLLETTWEKTVDLSKNISRKLEKDDVPAIVDQPAKANIELSTGQNEEAINEEIAEDIFDALPISEEIVNAQPISEQLINAQPINAEMIIEADAAEIITEPDNCTTEDENCQDNTQTKP